jgi:hypothetical protein
MPCHGAQNSRRENTRYRHLERPHGSLSNTKGVSYNATQPQLAGYCYNK